jgi:hypothetical protein
MPTEDDIPIIVSRDLEQFPFRCLAAISYRALLRSMEVLEFVHDEVLDAKPRQMVEELVDMLRTLAEAPADVTEATQVVPWGLLKEYNEVLDSIPYGTQRRAVFIAACDATGIYARKVNAVVSDTIVMYPEKASDLKQLEFQILLASAAHRDLVTLRDGLSSGRLDALAPVDSEVLGNLWPESEPNWQDFKVTSKAKPGKRKR